MAKVKQTLEPLTSGKLNKKSDVVYRVRNGKQQKYTPAENTNPPSKAQSAHRKHFGKVNALVNAIMADPQQEAEWTQRRLDFNRQALAAMSPLRYKTTRQFVFATISAQLATKEASNRRRNPIKLALPKGLKLHKKHFTELTTTELYELLKARFIVFYGEQNCRYLDMDDIDYTAIHIALHRKGRVIAYARLYQDTAPGVWHVGRLLSIERGKGYGKYVMEQAEIQAQKQGASAIILHAQMQVVPFYESLGYTTYGSIFQEADIPHICMKKSLINA